MASLKYKQYGTNGETPDLVLQKEFTLPLTIVKLGLSLMPTSVFEYALRKLLDDFNSKIEGIALKDALWALYEVCNEVAKIENPDEKCIIFDNKTENQKYIITVE